MTNTIYFEDTHGNSIGQWKYSSTLSLPELGQYVIVQGKLVQIINWRDAKVGENGRARYAVCYPED